MTQWPWDFWNWSLDGMGKGRQPGLGSHMVIFKVFPQVKHPVLWVQTVSYSIIQEPLVPDSIKYRTSPYS